MLPASAFTEFQDAACLGQWETFATDKVVPVAVLKDAAEVCAACPVLDRCRALADEIQPVTGVWAGAQYTKEGRRDV